MRIHRGLLILLGIWGALCAWARAIADDESPCVALSPGNVRFSESIGLIGSRVPLRSAANGAVEQWGGCLGYGKDFPAFRIGSKGNPDRRIEARSGANKLGDDDTDDSAFQGLLVWKS